MACIEDMEIQTIQSTCVCFSDPSSFKQSPLTNTLLLETG